MSEKVRSHLTHALLSLLLSTGIVMPLLGILEPSFQSNQILLLIAGIIVAGELCNIRSKVAVIAGILLLPALGLYLLATNNLTILADILLAVLWRFRGIDFALPLVSTAAIAGLTAFITLLCFYSCLRHVSVMLSGCICFGMILLIYLTGSDHMIVWFLPALFSFLLMLLTSRFPETPFLPLIPFAALLIVAAFLLTQGGIKENSFSRKADELRQAVMDRLFFTEPRDVFSLSSEGYYPEGQDQLGGKPDPDNDPVMQVAAPRSVYLRGVVFNEYTGRTWRNTTGGRRYLLQSVRSNSQRISLFDEDLPPAAVRNSLCDPASVTVHMLSDSASTLFVPQRVRELIPGGDLVPYYSNSSELFVTRNLKSGDTYTVSAPLFAAGDPGLNTLIEVCSTLEDSKYDRIVQTYIALPGHLEEPVYELAREASSVASAPYDKALAIQSWLSRHFRYTLDVDPQPSDIDFVTRFLLDTKEGYCTYFASAMTVLCRMAGLPARYVEGYLAEPGENGIAYVTGLSAHAWTEVYFKGFGWLTFDATPHRSSSGQGNNNGTSAPPSPEPSSEPSPEQETPSPTPEPPESENTEDKPSKEPNEPDSTPEPSQSPTDETDETPYPKPDEGQGDELPSPPPDNGNTPTDSHGSLFSSFPWWLLLLLIPLLFILRLWLSSPSFRDRRAHSDTARFDVWAQEITDLLHAENLDRNPGESPMAFGRRVDRTGLFGVALGPVGECVSLIRYSRSQVTETDISLLRDSSILLKGELSRPARLRLMIRRFFIPLKRRESL